jgi:anti-sigma factor RsiW
MTCDESRTLLFLDDDLDTEQRADFDQHLLDCEACWTAVTEDRRGRALAEELREPAPAGLADRIRLAAETRRATPPATPPAPAAAAPARAPFRWRPRPITAAAAVLLVLAGVGTTLAITSSSPPAGPASATGPSMAATLAAVHLGHALPMHVAGPAAPVPTELGQPVSMTVAGVELSVTYYRVDGGEALLVESHRPFAMPSGGAAGHAAGAWTAQVEGLTVWAANGPMSAAIVTPMPGEAAALARYLRMSL